VAVERENSEDRCIREWTGKNLEPGLADQVNWTGLENPKAQDRNQDMGNDLQDQQEAVVRVLNTVEGHVGVADRAEEGPTAEAAPVVDVNPNNYFDQ
jgi:hypothetical protein